MAMQFKLKDPDFLTRYIRSEEFQNELRQSCLEDWDKKYRSDILVTIGIPKSEIIAEDVCPEKAELEALKAQVIKAVDRLSAGDIDGVWKALGAEP
jgi:hypothetical protein